MARLRSAFKRRVQVPMQVLHAMFDVCSFVRISLR